MSDFQRGWIAAAALIAGAAGGPCFAQTSTPSPAPMSKADADAAVMAYYPAKARAAGIEGKAVLKCGLSDRARLENCSLMSEQPASYGFGAAALALSQLSQDNPDVPARPRPNGQEVTFKFTLKPPGISPNTLVPTHFRTDPAWTRRPSGSEFYAAYPRRAKVREIGGHSTIHCIVTADAEMSACSVIDESPPGYNFGAAALSLSKLFRMILPVLDGEMQAGSQVQIPMTWVPGVD